MIDNVQNWLKDKLGKVESSDTPEEIGKIMAVHTLRYIFGDKIPSSQQEKIDNWNEHWEEYKKWYGFDETPVAGDEIWTFESDKSSWMALAGRAGFALVKDGKVVSFKIIRMS